MRSRRPTSENSLRTRRVNRGRRSSCSGCRLRCARFSLLCIPDRVCDSFHFFFWLKLQVLQYKKRCGDLEQILQEKTSELDKHLLSVSETCSVLQQVLEFRDSNTCKSPSGCQRCL